MRYYQDYDIPMLGDIKFDKVVRKGAGLTMFEFALIIFAIFLGFWYYFNTTVSLYGKIVPIVGLIYAGVGFLASHGNDLKNYQHMILFFNYFLFNPKVYEPKRPESLNEFNSGRIYGEKIVIELSKSDMKSTGIKEDKNQRRIGTKI